MNSQLQNDHHSYFSTKQTYLEYARSRVSSMHRQIFFACSQNVSKILQARINHHGSVLAVRPATPMPPPPPQPPINGRNGDRGSAPPVRMLAPPSAKSLLDDPNTIKSLMGKEDPAATATYK